MLIFVKQHQYINLQYLVVGTGRCGTVSTSRLLTKAGIPCGHESIFNSEGGNKAVERIKTNTFVQSYTSGRDGATLPDKIIADASYMAVPFLDLPILNKVKIIHLVRHPLEVISSFVYGVNHFQGNHIVKEWDDFIERHLPSINEYSTPVEKAAHFYVAWNNMIHKKDFFHRIEDNPQILLDKMGLNYSGPIEVANTFPRDGSLSFDDLPLTVRPSIEEIARLYEYV